MKQRSGCRSAAPINIGRLRLEEIGGQAVKVWQGMDRKVLKAMRAPKPHQGKRECARRRGEAR